MISQNFSTRSKLISIPIAVDDFISMDLLDTPEHAEWHINLEIYNNGSWSEEKPCTRLEVFNAIMTHLDKDWPVENNGQIDTTRDYCERCNSLIWRLPLVPMAIVRQIASACGLRVIFRSVRRGDVCYANKSSSGNKRQCTPLIVVGELRPPHSVLGGGSTLGPEQLPEGTGSNPTGEVE
jgi:hypothetical protein